MPYGMQAKRFPRQTLDAIAFVGALDMLFGHRKPDTCRAGFCFARQNNDPVARESHGVIKDILEFGGAQQARAFGEAKSAQRTPRPDTGLT